jgi:hypothetical protein
MPKRMQHHFTGIYVVPQTIVAPANSPLTVAGLHLRQLLNIVSTATIMWIVSEDGQKFFQRRRKL